MEPEGFPPEVDAEGVPDEPDTPWDKTVLPDGLGIEEIEWSAWYARCPTYAEVWRVVCDGADWVAGYTLITPPGNILNTACVSRGLWSRTLYGNTMNWDTGVEKLTLELPRFYR